MKEVWPNDEYKKYFYSVYGNELNNIKDCSEYKKGALYWKYKNSKYIDMIKLGWPVLPISYERLVINPRSILKYLFKFLDIDWHEDLMKHHERKHDESNGLMTVGNTMINREIDKE